MPHNSREIQALRIPISEATRPKKHVFNSVVVTLESSLFRKLESNMLLPGFLVTTAVRRADRYRRRPVHVRLWEEIVFASSGYERLPPRVTSALRVHFD